MAATQEQAIEVLNAAKLAADGNAKVDQLRALLELVVRKEPGLLPEFLPEVLELQVDPSPAVKRYLADFIDAALAASPCPPVLQPSLQGLQGLVADGVAATAKRALQSCYPAFRTAYTLVALRGGEAGAADALRLLWEAAQALKLAVAGVAAASGGNDTVRMAAAKFLEQAVLLLTAEMVPAVAGVSAAPAPLPPGNAVTDKAALVRDAQALLAQLVALLKQRVGEQVSGPVAASAIRAAGGIALQRPQFLGRLLPPLLVLANSGAYGVAAAAGAGVADEAVPGAGSGQPAVGAGPTAVANALKAVLLALARSSHASALPWRKKLVAALEALGAADALEPAAADRPDKRSLLRDDEPSKRLKLDGIQPQPQQGAPAPPAAMGAALASQPSSHAPPLQPQPVPGPTPPDQLGKVLVVLQALVSSGDAPMLAGVVGSLQPAVLADVVMAYMQHLPPQHWLPPDSTPLEPWVLQLLQLVADQATLPAAAPGQLQQQQAAVGGPAPPMPEAAAAGTAASIPQDVQQPQLAGQQQQQRGERRNGAGLSLPQAKQEAAATAAAKVAARPVPPVATFRLEPVPLTEQQQRQLRMAAVQRILQTDKTSRQQLRTALVAKLAAQTDGSMALTIMQQLVQGVASSSASDSDSGSCCELEVALQWLNVLYARECHAEAEGKGTSGAADAQRPPPGAGSRSNGRASTSAAGSSPYEATLLQLLLGLRQALPPSSKVIVRVLLEAPALPMPAVRQFLQQVTEGGPDWCTLTLLAARDVILQRPPSREPLVQLVLDACAAATSDTRSKAVRLVANRLFSDPGMAPQIEQSARQRLDAMLLPTATPAATSAAPEAEGRAGSPSALAATATGEAAGSGDLGQQQVTETDAEEAPAAPTGPSDIEAAQLCALYCALCTKKHSLLRHLFEVYGQTSDGGRAAIQRNAGGLAKTLGAGAPALLAVVQDPPADSLPLVLQMLHVLTEAAVPPALLVTACLQLYDSCKDARALVPALRAMDRVTALRLLPALLDLQPELLRPALQRLVAPLPAAAGGDGQQSRPPVVSPEELLSALHTLDTSRDASLQRKTIQAVTVCISSPALFPPEALAACINQLLTRVPLPLLFMRTVIQTVAAAPKLRIFVVGVLRQLAARQVWKDTTQWKGWLMCAQQTVPESFPALLGLPADVLGAAAKAMPQATRQSLVSFAKAGSMAVPATTLAVLEPQLQQPEATATDPA